MREAVRKPLFQGHLVGSLLPIPEVEGKEGSRYPRHRWTFSFSVMCYFQIRTYPPGYFKAQERKKQDCNALPTHIVFRTFRIFRKNSETATWATWAIVGLSHSVASKRSCLVARGAWCILPAPPQLRCWRLMSHAHAHPHGTHAIPAR